MRILIACERSGIVRDAFRARGFAAWSCDTEPTQTPGPHIQRDVRDVLTDGWDMMIAHPPCTYLSSSGLHWNGRVPDRAEKTESALAFVRMLLQSGIRRIAVENPVGRIGTQIRKASQYVHPYEFGDDASKRTGLWLVGLPKLRIDPDARWAGRWVEWPRGSGKMVERWGNQTDSGQNRLGPSETRSAERAQTYPGIAKAMAEQWG